jgi:hypothetical protein
MASKWVDNTFYFGPDRRKRDAGKRWGDKRKRDDSGEPPPLGAVLRRLRVVLIDMRTPDDRQRALQLTRLAMVSADRMGLPACADAISDAARCITNGDVAGADAKIVEAQSRCTATPG